MTETLLELTANDCETVTETKILPEIIDADMTLKYRVGGRPGTVGHIRREAIEMAERAVELLSNNYIDVARGQVVEILTRMNVIHKTPKECNGALMKLSIISREIKGQARSCGYNLLTQVAESLYNFVSKHKNPDRRDIEFMDAHIAVMQHIVNHNLRGDGGEIGKELLKTITVAHGKLARE